LIIKNVAAEMKIKVREGIKNGCPINLKMMVTNEVISKATYITLPFIPSPQGRGNITTLSPGGRGRG